MDGVIIDLRKKEDFDRGHIPGAINMPFDKFDGFEGEQIEFPGLSKTKINYLYCYELLCNLSQKAAFMNLIIKSSNHFCNFWLNDRAPPAAIKNAIVPYIFLKMLKLH